MTMSSVNMLFVGTVLSTFTGFILFNEDVLLTKGYVESTVSYLLFIYIYLLIIEYG